MVVTKFIISRSSKHVCLNQLLLCVKAVVSERSIASRSTTPHCRVLCLVVVLSWVAG